MRARARNSAGYAQQCAQTDRPTDTYSVSSRPHGPYPRCQRHDSPLSSCFKRVKYTVLFFTHHHRRSSPTKVSLGQSVHSSQCESIDAYDNSTTVSKLVLIVHTAR